MKRSHPHDNNKPPQISPQQQPILSAALPLLQQQHALLNLGAVNSLMQQMPGANTSSSGKRKASNPQKFTRFESSNNSDSTTDNTPSPSVAAAVNNLSRTQVATALQFMPSFLSTMMQQHMNNAAAARNNHHHQNSKDEVRFRCSKLLIKGVLRQFSEKGRGAWLLFLRPTEPT